MRFSPTLIANNRNTAGAWDMLWRQRSMYDQIDQAVRRIEAANGLEVNADGLAQEFWRDLDAETVRLRDTETGMEIVNDLMGIQTPVDIGKTVKMYSTIGNIDQTVAISLDGQPPYAFDHVEYGADGDPIPIITAGYGANWRHVVGLRTVNVDLLMDSQIAKVGAVNTKTVDLVLDGAETINVQGYQSQGLRNHRNTQRIDLTPLNINLATADATALINFFNGPFRTLMRENRVDWLDVLWVSDEIDANLSKIYIENGVTLGTVRDHLLKFIRVREIRPTFKFTGNEFLGYRRSREYLSPLVAMPMQTIALPRPLPQTNYNFQIMLAMGMQVKVDEAGRGGVFYGANLT